jgi:hypothetical protein
VANVLARGQGKGVITEAQGEAFLEMLSGIRIDPDAATFPRSLAEILQLARRYRLSSYDASYLEWALRAAVPCGLKITSATQSEVRRNESACRYAALDFSVSRSLRGNTGSWRSTARSALQFRGCGCDRLLGMCG